MATVEPYVLAEHGPRVFGSLTANTKMETINSKMHRVSFKRIFFRKCAIIPGTQARGTFISWVFTERTLCHSGKYVL